MRTIAMIAMWMFFRKTGEDGLNNYSISMKLMLRSRMDA